MTQDDPRILARQVDRLRAQVRVHRWVLLGLVLLAVAFGTLAWSRPNGALRQDVVRARQVVVEDSAGNPRLVLGAPIGQLPGRERSDRTTGLLVLDRDGDDRINVGQPTIDPQVQGTVHERQVSGAGIVINDSEGDERTGWGVHGDGNVVLGLDYHTREALTLVATDSAAAVSLRSPRKNYVRTRLLVRPEGARWTLWDTTDTERLRVKMDDRMPAVVVSDTAGAARDLVSGG